MCSVKSLLDGGGSGHKDPNRVEVKSYVRLRRENFTSDFEGEGSCRVPYKSRKKTILGERRPIGETALNSVGVCQRSTTRHLLKKWCSLRLSRSVRVTSVGKVTR